MKVDKYMPVLAIFSFLLLSACEHVVDHKGFQTEHARINEVHVNQDTCQSVRDKVGSPTVELPYPDLENRTVWYYVSRKVEDKTFSLPNVVEQKTYVLKFDASGILRSLESSNKHTDVNMSKTVTESGTYESSLMRDMFGSFGRNLAKRPS